MAAPRSASENPVRELSLALDLGIEPSLISVSIQDDGTLAVLPLPRMVTLSCFVDDIHYNISIAPDDMGESSMIKIRGTVGIMPFTIQSPERRNAIRQIVQATSIYECGHLMINKHQKIVALSETHLPHPPHLTDVMTAMVRMQATLKPFLDLLGEYLGADGHIIDPTPETQPETRREAAPKQPTSTENQSFSSFSAFSIGFDESFIDDGKENT